MHIHVVIAERRCHFPARSARPGWQAATTGERRPECPQRGFQRVREGGRVLLTEIRFASNCSTGSCLSNFNKRISSKNSN